MKRDGPTPRARENWTDLDREQRFAAIQWTAMHLRRTERVGELGAGVVGVGAGMRERTRTKRFTDEPVLVVYVQEKWSRAKAAAKPDRVAVPEHVQVTVPVDERRLVLAIPTDVVKRPPPPRAQALPAAVRAVPGTASAGGGAVTGAACCLVRNDTAGDDKLYLLGCHHVIYRSKVQPGAVGDASATAHELLPGKTTGTALGKATRAARFGPGLVPSFDAALVRLNGDGRRVATDAAYWHVRVNDWTRSLQELMLAGSQGLRLVTRERGEIRLGPPRQLFDQPVNYGGVTLTVSEVIECRAQPGGLNPIGGDSGSPLVFGNLLAAMHIAGNGPLSYAIPAYHLLGASTFTPKLRLADDRIG